MKSQFDNKETDEYPVALYKHLIRHCFTFVGGGGVKAKLTD